jgi:hypothetical protein
VNREEAKERKLFVCNPFRAEQNPVGPCGCGPELNAFETQSIAGRKLDAIEGRGIDGGAQRVRAARHEDDARFVGAKEKKECEPGDRPWLRVLG